jgi:hypothetical protein
MAIMAKAFFLETKKRDRRPRFWKWERRIAACQGATAGRTPRVISNETVVRGVITRRAFPILENQSMQDRDDRILWDFAPT